MKDIRCLLGRHRFSDWVEVENHLERRCQRCPHVEVKYPDPLSVLIKLGVELGWSYFYYKKWGLLPSPPYSGRLKDER